MSADYKIKDIGLADWGFPDSATRRNSSVGD